MKKTAAALLTAVLLIAVGCEKSDEKVNRSISVYPESISFDSSGGINTAQGVWVTSTDDWTASCDEDWVSVSPSSGSAATGAKVSVFVDENINHERTATISFKNSYLTAKVSVSQDAADVPYGDGSVDDPYSADAAIDIIDGGATEDIVYVHGIVSQIESIDTSEGYASYYISSDGSTSAAQLYVYLGHYLGNVKFTSEDLLQSGDDVVLCGILSLSGSTPTLGRDNYIHSLNGVSDPDVCSYMFDPLFKKYCRDNFDTDGDGKISFEEAAAVEVINCDTALDFTGIEYFSGLLSFTSSSAENIDLRYNTELTLLDLSGTPITEIDLSHNTKLMSLVLSGTPVTELDLSNNTELTSLDLSGTPVTELDLSNNTELTSLDLSGTPITELDLSNNTELTSLDLSGTPVTELDLSLNTKITALDSKAFYNCTDLTSITLPESLTAIGESAFEECESLTSVSIPNNVTSIGESAFLNCIGLTSVSFPDELTVIGDFAFQSCTSLTSVSLHEGLTEIGEDAFRSCTSLTSVSLPKGLTTTGVGTFYGCTGLTSVSFPDELTTIGSDAFYGCGNLTSVSFPDELTKIGDFAFQSCTSLTSVSLPERLTSIGYRSFYNCTSLTTVYISATTPPTLGSSAFYHYSGSALYVPSESTTAYEESDWSQYFDTISAM